MQNKFKFVSAEEAAGYVQHGDVIGLADLRLQLSESCTCSNSQTCRIFHAEGKKFKIGMYTGASTGVSVDGALAKADAVLFRTPYQSNKDMRNAINAGKLLI
jgi:acyl-CoA hydrolase